MFSPLSSDESFNSLQTGRHVETTLWNSSFLSFNLSRFNSLQTGRHVETGERTVNRKCVVHLQVSIPFKREGTWKQKMKNLTFVLIIGLFQFPSNGKARGNSPHFRPRRAVAPNTPKPNTNCAGTFFTQKFTPKIP